RFPGRRFQLLAPALQTPGRTELDRAAGGHDVPGPRGHSLLRAAQRLHHRSRGRQAGCRIVSDDSGGQCAATVESDGPVAPGVPGRSDADSRDVLLQRGSSLSSVNRLLAIVGPTATGKSALAIALARRFGGDVVACDSTAVYRGIDIGTDKVPADAQVGIRHHRVDLVEPTVVFSAAAYAAEAGRVVRDIAARGRLPILAGGTGFYYRALFRGLFPGPARNEALRARLSRLVALRGPERLHRWLAHVDADSARRIQPRDTMRIVRALEVYLVTGEPLTAHFARTTSPVADFDTFTIGLRLSRDELRPRVATRVANQFS